ncbi:putative RNA-binding protein [Trypanosoma conorhini]|uniref:Putative RNA-binding protein n=1 Tax=Trypanosoma conorhini TaxID=83891 RepID=A0A422NN18_9TRYP|nr:putative RNA-binding protein [Trypanosoma conorhini]RNF06892.1 putative RNA-binding protein [Trypanosoma conorhini]
MKGGEESSPIPDADEGLAGPPQAQSRLVQPGSSLRRPVPGSGPNDGEGGAEARERPAATRMPAGASDGAALMGPKRGFAVAACEADQSTRQAGHESQRPSSACQADAFISKLNPNAKEFRAPCFQINGAWAATSAPMLHSTPFCESGPLAAVALPAGPTAAATPWQAGAVTGSESLPAPDRGAQAQRWPHASASPITPNSHDPTAVPSTALTPDVNAEQTMDKYVEYCRGNGYHLVSVSNLDPSTTQKELLDIFFPFSALNAKLLPPHCQAQHPSRAGVVFFPCRGTAELAVGKFDNFVPRKQHSQLKVRYLGPDASEAGTHDTLVSSANSAKPLTTGQQHSQPPSERPRGASRQPSRPRKQSERDSIHEAMLQFVMSGKELPYNGDIKHFLALHGLNAANAERVLQSNFVCKGAKWHRIWTMNPTPSPVATNAPKTVSALVGFTQESVAKEVAAWVQQQNRGEDKIQEVDIVYLNSLEFACKKPSIDTSEVHGVTRAATNNSSQATVCPNSNMMFLGNDDVLHPRSHSDPSLPRAGVHSHAPNTENGTPSSSLHGGHAAELHPAAVEFGAEPRRSGVAGFGKEAKSREEVEKWVCPVQTTPSRPMNARQLREGGSPQATKILAPAFSHSGMAESLSSAVPGAKLNEMVAAVQKKLKEPALNDKQLMEQMWRVITHPDTTNKVVEQLASVITGTLTEKKQNAGTLSTPLANALVLLHEKLNIPRNGSNDVNMEEGLCNPDVRRYMDYMLLIARALILLFTDETKPPELRKVAAVLSGYMFRFSCLRDQTPYTLSVSLMNRHKAALDDARKYMKRRLMSKKFCDV